MTGEQYVANCKGWLETTMGRGDISAEEADAIRFALMNWHKFEPVLVSDWLKGRDMRRLSDTIYNLLGTRDPDEVEKWIAGARLEIAVARSAFEEAR